MEPDLDNIRVENDVALRKARRYAKFLSDLDLYERSMANENNFTDEILTAADLMANSKTMRAQCVTAFQKTLERRNDVANVLLCEK